MTNGCGRLRAKISIHEMRWLTFFSATAQVGTMRALYLLIYYAIAQHFPTQPMPSWRFGYALRRFLVKRIFASCGDGVIIKQHAYFGDGRTLRIGHRTQIGLNSRIDHEVTIGDDVLMGPDVVMLSGGHAFEAVDIPINQQGATACKPIVISNDVWIGTRVIILPGVEIGSGSVIGAGSIVSRSIPPYSIAVGAPAKVIRTRGKRESVYEVLDSVA
jgi:maltose O-acetyltransferase